MPYLFRRALISLLKKIVSRSKPDTVCFLKENEVWQFAFKTLQTGLLHSFLLWSSRDRSSLLAASGLSSGFTTKTFAWSLPPNLAVLSHALQPPVLQLGAHGWLSRNVIDWCNQEHISLEVPHATQSSCLSRTFSQFCLQVCFFFFPP